MRTARPSVRRPPHGLSGTVEHRIWTDMMSRCRRDARYGGRGIRVCDRWLADFRSFFEDMGPRPSAAHSVERKDNDGDYEPGNCVWATAKEQARNRSTTIHITIDGVTRCMAEWCELSGVSQKLAQLRIARLGWPAEMAVTRPPGSHRIKATHGESNGSAKLTESDVLYIVSESQRGATRTSLAKRFGLSISGISRIVLGKNWSHIVKPGDVPKSTRGVKRHGYD